VVLYKAFGSIVKSLLLNKLKYVSVIGFLGVFSDLQSSILLKRNLVSLGTSRFSNFDYDKVWFSNNKSLEGRAFLIINYNLRILEPLLHYKLRRMFLQDCKFFYIGSHALFSFYIKQVSNQKSFLIKFLEGKT